MNRPKHILPVIVISQMMGTSLWFSGNSILDSLQRQFGLKDQAVGALTSSVQFGFIGGTLLFAFFVLADRFSPRLVFFVCALGGALANLGICYMDTYETLLVFRFLTGFFLAGVYPVGMKIASGWHDHDLGKAIGFLVGALVVGTALPHFLKGAGRDLPWESVVFSVSGIAALGGLLMLAFVPDGPHLSRNSRFHTGALIRIFRSPPFRASAFGYFGHMWELYAFWAFAPLVLQQAFLNKGDWNLSLWSFAIIAAGSVGCVWGGLASIRHGSARVAGVQLAASGLCCLLSPFLFFAPPPALLAFLIFWGIVVVGDSPQFSTLNAQNAPKELIGSALTIANCLGFAVSILSIQLLSGISSQLEPEYWLAPLALGPVLGLVALKPLLISEASATIKSGRPNGRMD